MVMNSLFYIILVLAILIILIAISVVIISLIWKPTVNKYLDLKEKDQKINKYTLYNNVNIETVNTIIDAYINSYVDRYVLYKFLAQKTVYITKEDTENMIKDITKNIALEISDIYLYYISLLYSYNSDEELLVFIHNRVLNASIEYVTNYNASNVPAT